MKKSTAFLMALAFLLIGCFGTYVFTKEVLVKEDGDGDYDKGMEEILWYLNNSYYEDPDVEDVVTGAYKGAVLGLGDPYSEYLTKAEYDALIENESGKYSGIGVTITLDSETGAPYALIVQKGSPAEAAGIHKGDVFVAVDGVPIDTTRSLDSIAMELRGEVGTPVEVTILRNGTTMKMTIIRSNIVIDKVEYRMLDNDIGYIKVVEFNGNCVELFDEALKYITGKGAKGLVLDLRDNPGGYVNYCTAIADALMPAGDIVTTVDRTGKRQTVKSDSSCLGIPVSVLMNSCSASASEILAGALKDSGVGKVVGVTSYGKGVVQRYFFLTDSDGVLKVTIASYRTPNGTDINQKGITPDYEVELPEELIKNPAALSDENDTQLQKAMEVLRPRMK